MAKSSRKGKKAWRKNIDTSEVCLTASCRTMSCHLVLYTDWQAVCALQVERAAEEKSRAERLGTDVDVLPDADLFFIDKVSSLLYLTLIGARHKAPCSL